MSRKWIQFPHIEGKTSRQAHADLPAGTYEREIGREGFFGPATHMHHKHPPTAWLRFQGANRPRAFDSTHIEEFGPSPWDAPQLLHNSSVRFRVWGLNRPMEALARNADGDELLFIHSGAGDLYCDYGRLSFSEGDYIILPRSTMWRIEPGENVRLLLIEASNSAYQLPEKGIVGPHAIFDPAVLQVPAIDDRFLAQQDEKEWSVQVKASGEISTITFPFNPLDAVGWHGDLSPVKVNWRDIRPLMSHRYHLPPSAHTTFVANRFVVCTFVPRPFETDPDALKVPFFHNNDDYDEVIFYHKGSFFSRDNIHPGMISFHPRGFTHGPHPKALENAFAPKSSETDEVAVMIDTRDRLEIAPVAETVEWKGYVDSWRTKTSHN